MYGVEIRHLVVTAGWAPLAVVAAHAVAAALFGHEPRLDPAMHFLGGAAIAYFLNHALATWKAAFGHPAPLVRRLVVFCMATTVAVFWEFAEYFAGAALGLYSQMSLRETMGDLVFGCAGAGVFLAVNAFPALVRSLLSRPRPS